MAGSCYVLFRSLTLIQTRKKNVPDPQRWLCVLYTQIHNIYQISTYVSLRYPTGPNLIPQLCIILYNYNQSNTHYHLLTFLYLSIELTRLLIRFIFHRIRIPDPVQTFDKSVRIRPFKAPDCME